MNALAIAALVTWLVAGAVDLYLLGPLLSGSWPRDRGGAKQTPVPQSVLLGHLALAACGLASWIRFMVSGSSRFAWLAIALLGPAIGLAFSIFSGRDPAGRRSRSHGSGGDQPAIFGITSDEMLARALEDEALTTELVDNLLANVLAGPAPGARRPSALVATALGTLAVTTFLVAVLAAVTTS